MRKLINKEYLTILFLIVYIAAPYYFYIKNIKFIYIWSIVGILMIMIANNKILIYRRPITIMTVTVFYAIISNFLIYIVSGEFFLGILFLISTLLVGIFIIPNINDKKIFLKTIDGIIYFSGVVGIFGIVEEIFRFNIFSLFNNTNTIPNYNPLRFGTLRIISFHAHAIIYCVWLMFILALIYYRLTMEKNKKVYISIYIILIINALLTLSRSSLITLFVSQILLLYRSGFTFFLKKMGQILTIIIVFIVISMLFIPQLKNLIYNVIDMIIAIYNDDYTNKISDSFGNDNLTGYGNRFDLYKWVNEEMANNWLFGKGIFSEFSHDYINRDGYWTSKKSIEVEYLNTLYHKGLFGLIAELILYISLLIITFGKKAKKMKSFETIINFNTVFNTVLLCYCIELFAVNASTERNTFYILIILLMCYNFFLKEKKENHKDLV